ncbi:hypothetical protein BCR37DRAFT_387014 [Protomyces lactucae-debilis]|uniref:Uncharacterized protein n=1 Tax=Protomyces lactucae-debilis TaxID=2754530 RepID=A0A1Y2FIS1_PROLT|nr:uncharacterized protein BCR37DRAFT_387014 [Protomyces lactucae-debilis]ORY83146.1 hypothetical protein BCR37DRAFT_387014 [Protomyces lactucae-debilis]
MTLHTTPGGTMLGRARAVSRTTDEHHLQLLQHGSVMTAAFLGITCTDGCIGLHEYVLSQQVYQGAFLLETLMMFFGFDAEDALRHIKFKMQRDPDDLHWYMSAMLRVHCPLLCWLIVQLGVSSSDLRAWTMSPEDTQRYILASPGCAAAFALFALYGDGSIDADGRLTWYSANLEELMVIHSALELMVPGLHVRQPRLRPQRAAHHRTEWILSLQNRAAVTRMQQVGANLPRHSKYVQICRMLSLDDPRPWITDPPDDDETDDGDSGSSSSSDDGDPDDDVQPIAAAAVVGVDDNVVDDGDEVEEEGPDQEARQLEELNLRILGELGQAEEGPGLTCPFAGSCTASWRIDQRAAAVKHVRNIQRRHD